MFLCGLTSAGCAERIVLEHKHACTENEQQNIHFGVKMAKWHRSWQQVHKFIFPDQVLYILIRSTWSTDKEQCEADAGIYKLRNFFPNSWAISTSCPATMVISFDKAWQTQIATHRKAFGWSPPNIGRKAMSLSCRRSKRRYVFSDTGMTKPTLPSIPPE